MNSFLKSLNTEPRGVFVYIDDDPDEHFILKIAMKELGLSNQVLYFRDGVEALNYLKDTNDEIFIILSDINMPRMDGLELKRMIEMTPELKIKAIPFIYHTNTSRPVEIKAAYSLNIQAYLKKSPSVEGTIESLKKIISLWTDCIHPKDLR